MSVKDWIQLTASLITAITSVAAIIISVLALKTTKRSIENANRPYVVAYLNWDWLQNNLREWLIIKNFGKTGAVINSIEFSEPWLNSQNDQPIFNKMDGYFIAPNQKFVSFAEIDASGDGHERARKKPITITIHYSWDEGSKSEDFTHTFTPDAYTQFETSRQVSGFSDNISSLEKFLSNWANEFIRRNM